MLDHLAKPSIKAGTLDPWRADIQALATHPNVTCKLSGMVTEAAWQGWKKEDFAPYLEVALEAFGPERLMYGSDWPVCLLAAEYPDVFGIVEDFLGKLSDDERQQVLGGTATQFYGLTT